MIALTAQVAGRRRDRQARLAREYGAEADAAQDILELVDYAWYGTYSRTFPAGDVIDDILICAAGSLTGLASAARLAVLDRRDLWMWAESRLPHRDRG